MKIINFLLLAFFCISVSNAQKKSFENQKNVRIEKVINSHWTFNYFPDIASDKGYELPGFDDSKWSAISLPHSWNTYETTGELYPFIVKTEENDKLYWWIGWGWYRKHFSINRDNSGKKVFIEFDGVQEYCKVWINGKYLGDHKDGYGSFGFDVTQLIKFGEDNVLAVAVNNKQNDQFKPLLIPTDNDSVYSGIYRAVTIVLKNKLYIPNQESANKEGGVIISTSQVSGKEDAVRVQTLVKNDNPQKKNCTLQTSIIDGAGKTLQVIKSEAVINSGQLYIFDQTSKSVLKTKTGLNKDPNLNKVVSEVIDQKEVVDNFISHFGSKITSAQDTSRILAASRVLEELVFSYFKNTDKNTSVPAKVVTAGEPAKIVLSCSSKKIVADRGSVVKITADIVDNQGNHVFGANNSINWKVTGPAPLVCPSIYESDINKNNQTEVVRYKNTPVSNAIRSLGKPGKIRITVSASGLASGSLEIDAEEIKPDNSIIAEPALRDEGRKPVARITLNVNRLEDAPREIIFTKEEFNLGRSDKHGYTSVIRDYILKNNASIDTSSIDFKTLVDLFASQLLNNNGHLVADDYNFNVDHYNNCKLISGYIGSTKLPPLFKEGLKKYYANVIIRQGNEKNAGDEMNWLNWIPSGGVVAIVQNENTNTNTKLKGVVFTRQTELAEIINVVYPVFVNFSEEAKERALIFIAKMNPYVKVLSINEQTLEGDKKKIANVSYTAEKGQPILIPLLKFISE